MKIGFVIITYNIPVSLMTLQAEAIRMMCTDDDFEIVIVDNSSDEEKASHLKYHASLHNLRYIRTSASSVNGSASHSFAANRSYQMLCKDYDIMAYLDHDLIPIKQFSPSEILHEGIMMAGLRQGSQKIYYWPGCVFIKSCNISPTEVDFSPNNEFGLDTGGNLYPLLEKYGEAQCLQFDEQFVENPHYFHPKYGYYTLINNGTFMHFVGASNWENLSANEERLNSLINIAKNKIYEASLL